MVGLLFNYKKKPGAGSPGFVSDCLLSSSYDFVKHSLVPFLSVRACQILCQNVVGECIQVCIVDLQACVFEELDQFSLSLEVGAVAILDAGLNPLP